MWALVQTLHWASLSPLETAGDFRTQTVCSHPTSEPWLYATGWGFIIILLLKLLPFLFDCNCKNYRCKADGSYWTFTSLPRLNFI